MQKLSKKEWVAVAIGVAFIGYMFFGDTVSGVLGDINGSNTNNMNNETNATNTDIQASGNPALSVKVEDLVVGKGAEIQKGMQVAVNYVLKLSDGTLIQDSKQVNNGQPFVFTAGAGQLIPGWEMGILGMKVGGKRMITIPPELGYGAQAQGPIPANSTLVFEIEVVSATATPTQ